MSIPFLLLFQQAARASEEILKVRCKRTHPWLRAPPGSRTVASRPRTHRAPRLRGRRLILFDRPCVSSSSERRVPVRRLPRPVTRSAQTRSGRPAADRAASVDALRTRFLIGTRPKRGLRDESPTTLRRESVAERFASAWRVFSSRPDGLSSKRRRPEVPAWTAQVPPHHQPGRHNAARWP